MSAGEHYEPGGGSGSGHGGRAVHRRQFRRVVNPRRGGSAGGLCRGRREVGAPPMRFVLQTEQPPVTHPTVDLGCGTWCTINYDSIISSALAIVVTIVAAVLTARSMNSERPNRVQALAEWAFSYVRSTSNENAPDASSFVVPLAATIGFYILVANYLDFIPITLIPNVHPANTDVNQTAAMAIVVFVLLHWYNIRLRGLKGYLSYYTRPHDLPILARVPFTFLNIIEEIVKPVTLALRLFGNLLAGILMLFVIGLLLPPVL